MTASAADATKLECTIIGPAGPHPHTHTVIFLHGRGDNAQNFSRSLAFSTSSSDKTLFDHFPSVRWVFPSSELRKPARFPNTTMSQWFDTWDVGNLSYREELQMPGLAESVASILAIYEEELGKLGGDSRRLVLAGISQGGAVVMHTLLNLQTDSYESRLGGVMGFSCRFPFPGRSLSQTRKILGLVKESAGESGEFEEESGLVQNTPVMIQHCLDDPLVSVDTGRQVRDTMTRFGAQVTWKEYPVGGHWIRSPEGIDDAVAWLRSHVGIVTPLGKS
ncbi:Phospholipase/Carboxylesterase family protein [Naviculisporaceae sp. PSN 640]